MCTISGSVVVIVPKRKCWPGNRCTNCHSKLAETKSEFLSYTLPLSPDSRIREQKIKWETSEVERTWANNTASYVLFHKCLSKAECWIALSHQPVVYSSCIIHALASFPGSPTAWRWRKVRRERAWYPFAHDVAARQCHSNNELICYVTTPLL